ncbi:hypothetical protein Pmani_036117 [Petrolisthes manimaculis]|uniref:Uncharacterized protein n=1 Tax=Petrolisthes manimaculis TaxID=1843537 RepID=A0AAE1NJE2_9EUCA|nr:hypothetical protein Pmani_036117 [Petrolisthes manimaculis]
MRRKEREGGKERDDEGREMVWKKEKKRGLEGGEVKEEMEAVSREEEKEGGRMKGSKGDDTGRKEGREEGREGGTRTIER